MIVLTLRTDKPEAEIGLFHDNKQLAYDVWEAHRALAETIHSRIDSLIKKEGKTLQDIEGIVCYKGPGSFTGLRIGLSVANALAYSLGVPIVGVEGEDGWLERGIDRIRQSENDGSAMPAYGAPVHITSPKK